MPFFQNLSVDSVKYSQKTRTLSKTVKTVELTKDVALRGWWCCGGFGFVGGLGLFEQPDLRTISIDFAHLILTTDCFLLSVHLIEINWTVCQQSCTQCSLWAMLHHKRVLFGLWRT